MIDMKKTKKSLRLRLTAHVEGYVKAIQDQELNTKEKQRKRGKDMQKKRTMDIKCRVCDQKGESVYHLVCSCWALAPSVYFKVRHNKITRILYQEVIKSDHIVLNPLEVAVKEPSEICYDMEIQTVSKVEKNTLVPIHHSFYVSFSAIGELQLPASILFLAYFNWPRFSRLISKV